MMWEKRCDLKNEVLIMEERGCAGRNTYARTTLGKMVESPNGQVFCK